MWFNLWGWAVAGNKRGQASRAALLAAGRSVFSAHRYDEVSIVEVARSVGAAAGAINYHFGSKRGFYLAVLQDAVAEFWEGLLALRGPPVDRLLRGLDMFLDYAEQQPGTFEALIADAADAEIRRLHERHRAEIARALALEITGSESTAVLRTALAGCLSFIEGTVLHWMHTRQITRTQLRDLLVANMFSTVLSAVNVDPEIELSSRALQAAMDNPLRLRDFPVPLRPAKDRS